MQTECHKIPPCLCTCQEAARRGDLVEAEVGHEAPLHQLQVQVHRGLRQARGAHARLRKEKDIIGAQKVLTVNKVHNILIQLKRF